MKQILQDLSAQKSHCHFEGYFQFLVEFLVKALPQGRLWFSPVNETDLYPLTTHNNNKKFTCIRNGADKRY